MEKENKQITSTPYLALGIGVGVALGAAFDNIGIGIALGVVFGIILQENSKKKKSE